MDIRLKILEDREKRINLIQYKTNLSINFFVTVKSNICGENKNIKVTNILIPLFVNKVVQNFEVVNVESIKSYDGDYCLIEIKNKNFVQTKKTLVKLENTNLGRFIDLDLYCKGENKSISRKDLKLPSRKCIICNDEYNICVKLKRHTKEEVVQQIEKSVKHYFVDNLVNNTVFSLKQEVTAHPKYGLVTKKSSGKHKDMDYSTFLLSIEAIKPYLYEYAIEGFSFNENTFNKLRTIGKKAEVSMLKATNGINTYKGVIFLFGLLLPSVVHTVYNGYKFLNIKDDIKFLSKNILSDFVGVKNKKHLTYGEKIYIKYGILGVRGVAKGGMSVAFSLVEKYLYDESCENDLIINILTEVMMNTDDTVLLHNNNIETLSYIKKEASDIMSLGGYSTTKGKEKIEELTKKCIQQNISPGGSADLVSIILTLIKVKKIYFMRC